MNHIQNKETYSVTSLTKRIMEHFGRERDELITPHSDTNSHNTSRIQTTSTTTSTNVKYLGQGHAMVERSDEAV